MRSSFLTALGLALGLGMIMTVRPVARGDEEPPPPPVPKGVEVLARGPVHEAYAQPTEVQPQPSPVIDREPPAPIDEVPPDQRPEGEDVIWIPGYWAFDTDRNNFLWVSGFWRVPPHGHKWVPGCWQQVDRGWQWVAGFWAPQEQEELQYVPEPPASVDDGPSTPAPDENSAYVPGCWVWRQTRFLWRPGFWAAFHPGWTWIPARYIWSPAGCVFVEGYWDRPLEARGLLFSPIAIDPTVLVERFTYVPQYVVQPDFLLTALFVQPATCHYYMGDYFSAAYERQGFIPWVDYRVTRGCPDANFTYYRTLFAGHAGWEENLRAVYAGRFRGDIPRPPHTWMQQTQLVQRLTHKDIADVNVFKNIHITNMQNVSALVPLSRVHNTRVTNLSALANVRATEVRSRTVEPRVLKLQAVPPAQRQEHIRAAAQVHVMAQQRREAQAKVIAQGSVSRTTAPRQVRLGTPPASVRASAGAKVDTQIRPAGPPPAPRTPPHEVRPIPPHEQQRPAPPPAPRQPISPPAPPPHQPPPPAAQPPHPPAHQPPPAPPPPQQAQRPPPPPPPKAPPPPPPPPKQPPKQPPHKDGGKG